MIRESILSYWTRVTRMVNGQVVQTTCCCPAAGASRRDCQQAKGTKNPCPCACHGHKTQSGVRFRQLDGEVPPRMQTEADKAQLAKMKAEIADAVGDSPGIRRT